MSPVKIVIFEDEFLLANDLKRQLQQFNFEVTAIFRKAEEGLDYLAGIKDPADFPEIILMDITLAGKMSGLEAGRIITRKYDTALVFLTGMSQLETFEEAFKTRSHAFMVKPFEIKQALVSIRLAVYQKELERKLKDCEAALQKKTGNP